MVENYKKKYDFDLFYFIKNNIDSDFYIYLNNCRKLINDEKTLKLFLSKAKDIRIIEDKGDILGVSGIWRVIEDNVVKEYIKINAINKDIFEKLIVVTIWNAKNNVFIKIKKGYKFINILRNKGFDYVSSGNNEILLVHSKFRKRE
jgi:hypothetical protein